MIIPKDNVKDLADIPNNIKRNLEVVPVSVVEEVLEHALAESMTPIEWKPEDSVDSVTSKKADGDLGVVTTH